MTIGVLILQLSNTSSGLKAGDLEHLENQKQTHIDLDNQIQNLLQQFSDSAFSIKKNHISSIITELSTKNSLQETSFSEFDEFLDLLYQLDDLISLRNVTGYAIANSFTVTDNDQILLGGEETEKSIISFGIEGMYGVFLEYNNELFEHVSEARLLPGTNETIVREFTLFLPADVYFDEAIKIRLRHNDNIEELQNDGIDNSLIGIKTILKSTNQEAVEFITGSGHENESAILSVLNKQSTQINELFEVIEDYESSHLQTKEQLSIGLLESANQLVVNMNDYSDKMEGFWQAIVDLTEVTGQSIDFRTTEWLINVGYSGFNSRIIDIIENNVKLIAPFLLDTWEMIEVVNEILIAEQRQFLTEFTDLVENDKTDEDSDSLFIDYFRYTWLTVLFLPITRKLINRKCTYISTYN